MPTYYKCRLCGGKFQTNLNRKSQVCRNVDACKRRQAQAREETMTDNVYNKDIAGNLTNLRDTLRKLEAPVTLGEWTADNVFGDPDLRAAMYLANLAAYAFQIAEYMLRQAIDAFPEWCCKSCGHYVREGMGAHAPDCEVVNNG